MQRIKLNLTMLLFPPALCLCALLAASVSASQADLDAEVGKLIADLKNQSYPMKVLASRVKWTGISDTRLFDEVESTLLSRLEKKPTRQDIEDQSWMVQILAFSGQDKYRDTLEHVLSSTRNKKLVRHTQNSVAWIDNFKRWNPVISRGLADVPKDRIEKQRVFNMLQADIPELVRSGASIVQSSHAHDEEMLEEVNKQLLARHKDVVDNGELAEAVAWLCKVLGESGNTKYLTTLEEVKDHASAKAVKRWSEKSLRLLRKTAGN